MTEPLTEDDFTTLREAAFGAVYLVSNADRGIFAMFRESIAAASALAGSTGVVQQALTTGDVPELPKGSPAEIEAIVLPALRRSTAILAAKAPAEVENYRRTVLAACEKAAGAASGVQSTESTEITKIKAALAEPTP